MRTSILALLCLVGLPQEEDPWAPHRKTKVLYAGMEGGHREKVFGAFLKKHFDVSKTIPLKDLSMKTAAEFDVVLVDWASQYGLDGYEKKKKWMLHSVPIQLGPEFTKPMVAMTYVGTQLRPKSKLDWY